MAVIINCKVCGYRDDVVTNWQCPKCASNTVGTQPTDVQSLLITRAYEFAELCSDGKAKGTMHSFVEWLEQLHN